VKWLDMGRASKDSRARWAEANPERAAQLIDEYYAKGLTPDAAIHHFERWSLEECQAVCSPPCKQGHTIYQLSAVVGRTIKAIMSHRTACKRRWSGEGELLS
jgi:hypothetical protein